MADHRTSMKCVDQNDKLVCQWQHLNTDDSNWYSEKVDSVHIEGADDVTSYGTGEEYYTSEEKLDCYVETEGVNDVLECSVDTDYI